MPWSLRQLSPQARAISASRRTDIPALYAPWFRARLDAGFAEYIPAGPPRRLRVSLRPEDVRWFVLWTRWPRPFEVALDELLDQRFPVLMNLTITGLGGGPVEPHSPPLERALEGARRSLDRLPAAAVQWRYDPVFLTERHDRRFHLETFTRIADALAGRVDRVAISPVQATGRRVAPDLRRYAQDRGDPLVTSEDPRWLELAIELRDRAKERGIPLVVCAHEPTRQALDARAAGCDQHAWACRAWPELASMRPPRARPTRQGCGCCEEVDIGVYDTCTLGCRYSYGSRDRSTAQRRAAQHDPSAPCLIP
jgi:hypothetical protein